MEAPKKLYLNQDDCLIWHCRSYKDDIEYTRTDAFIEKACKYFRTKKKCVFACIGEDVYQSILNEEEIEGFKNYMMKGE